VHQLAYTINQSLLLFGEAEIHGGLKAQKNRERPRPFPNLSV
jgi:hypothetical protein